MFARLLTFLLCLAVALAIGYRWGADKSDVEPPPVVEEVVAPTPNVIVALRQLARLEGAVMHLERVVDLKQKQSHFMGMVQAEDALILIAAGDVVAGVDLDGIENKSITIDWEARKVHLLLPAAEIFSARLDSERTYVYQRNTDLLAASDKNLESSARKQAERGFRAAALEAGILTSAERSVARTIEALLRPLGFTQITVEFRAAPTSRH